MIVYLSMVLWVFLMSAFFKGRTKRNLYMQTNGGLSLNMTTMPVAVVTFGYITFWAGMRTQFVDTAAYIASFEALPLSWDYFLYELREDSSPAFLLIEYFFKYLWPDNYRYWLMGLAIASSFPIILIFRKCSDNFYYSVMLFVLSTNFTWLMNGIRQFLAVTLLFACCCFLIDRKPYHWVIAVLLLSTIHVSVFIALPVYWFVVGKPFGRKMIIFIVGIMALAAFIDPLLSSAEGMFADTEIEGKLESIASDNGANFFRVVVALVPVTIAYINRTKIEKMNDPFINLCVNMSMVTAGIFFIATLTSGIMVGRFPMYFQLYSWILLPNIFERCYGTNKSLMYMLCTLGYMVWFCLMVGRLYYNSDITGFIQ